VIIFFLTYAVLALLGLSFVGSVGTRVSKPSAKARVHPLSSMSGAAPCSLT
jgi:hypothetical protein